MMHCFSLSTSRWISFYHVFNCGSVSASNISSTLFQRNHSLDLKCLEIGLAVSLFFFCFFVLFLLRLLALGSRNHNFITLYWSTGIVQRTAGNPSHLWLHNNLKLVLLGGYTALWHDFMALSVFPCVILLFFFHDMVTSSWAVGPQSWLKSHNPHDGLPYCFYSPMNSTSMRFLSLWRRAIICASKKKETAAVHKFQQQSRTEQNSARWLSSKEAWPSLYQSHSGDLARLSDELLRRRLVHAPWPWKPLKAYRLHVSSKLSLNKCVSLGSVVTHMEFR